MSDFAPLNALDIVRRVQDVLDYYPETGEFVWIKPPKYHPRLLGCVAGGDSTGYVMIKIDGQKFKAHRLAWLVMTGEWPSKRIDHIDGNSLNNVWSNLRLCDQSQNNGNKKRNAGKKLPKGVRKIGSRFQARISHLGTQNALGSYSTIEEAVSAYEAAAKIYFGAFARIA